MALGGPKNADFKHSLSSAAKWLKNVDFDHCRAPATKLPQEVCRMLIESACREWPFTLQVLCNSMFLRVPCFARKSARSASRSVGRTALRAALGGSSGRVRVQRCAGSTASRGTRSMFLRVACFLWLRARSARLTGTSRGGATGRGQGSKISFCDGVLEHYENH